MTYEVDPSSLPYEPDEEGLQHLTPPAQGSPDDLADKIPQSRWNSFARGEVCPPPETQEVSDPQWESFARYHDKPSIITRLRVAVRSIFED